MPHVIHFAAPPMLARRLRADIETAFQGFCLSPPCTHFEMFEAAAGYGQPNSMAASMADGQAVMTITAYPQLLNRVMEDKAAVASLNGLNLPPLRTELARAGLQSPHPDVVLIAGVPLVLAVDRRQAPDVQGWDDLLPLIGRGLVVAAPPVDTPLPYLFSAFLAKRWGRAETEMRAALDCASPPLEINKRLAAGEVAAGVLPPAFCRNARGGAVDLIWPTDGPLVAPVFAVIAPDAPAETRDVMRALLSPEMQKLFAELGGMLPVIDGVAGPAEMQNAGWFFQPTIWSDLLDQGRLMSRQLARAADPVS